MLWSENKSEKKNLHRAVDLIGADVLETRGRFSNVNWSALFS